MRLQIKGKNVEISEAIRSYAEEKLGKLERQLADPTQVELELAVERNPSIADKIVAEATIWTKGPTLRAKERSTDMRASIDLITDKLERQVTRYREKRRHRHREHDGQGVDAHVRTETNEEGGPVIVKTKQFTMHPMSAEEAVLQLELVGHDFFVFRHEDNGEINVVYRRRDGGYGLIEPS